MQRKGVTPDLAKAIMRTNTTAIGAVMVHRGEADSLICGTFGEFRWHMNYVQQVLGDTDHHPHGALSMMILEDGPLFIADTHVRVFPTPEQLAETAIGAARHVRRFGVEPKIAFCSQSQFGNQGSDSGKRLRGAIEILDSEPRDFCYEGEMNVDAALDAELRSRLLPNNRMEGGANVLIFSNADAASGVRNILKMKAGGLEVGPILMGMGNRAHIVTPGVTARGLLNMAAIAGTRFSSMVKIMGHGFVVVLLTIVTQIGGIAWFLGLWLRRPFLWFLPIYAGLTIVAGFIAPVLGRVPLPCNADGALQSQSDLYCAFNRHYVTSEMHNLATDLAAHMEQKFPGAITQTLDAGFPFVTGFPLLPHLSHDDGEKLDFAFYWADEKGEYLSGANRSPIGYWVMPKVQQNVLLAGAICVGIFLR